VSVVSGAHAYVLFGVDDALFCSAVPMHAACCALDSLASLSCVHLRLSPGMAYCHPAQKPQTEPKLHPWPPSAARICLFRPRDGSLDWDYPFDLCATLYRYDAPLRVSTYE
jgi:hypothetical protein